MADKEYIERVALLEMLNNKAKTDHEMGLYNHGALTESFIRFVERQPAADVVEVVHGRWIFEHDPINDPKKYFIRIVCSCCGLKTGQVSNFCPHCGAKMAGRKEQA